MSRTVVVLPLVPVTDTIGTREELPGGKRWSTMSPATSRGLPSRGSGASAGRARN